ncbi:hypothetical protein U1Q18_017543, partial [Sarracenia purpurea var. burkii]
YETSLLNRVSLATTTMHDATTDGDTNSIVWLDESTTPGGERLKEVRGSLIDDDNASTCGGKTPSIFANSR